MRGRLKFCPKAIDREETIRRVCIPSRTPCNLGKVPIYGSVRFGVIVIVPNRHRAPNPVERGRRVVWSGGIDLDGKVFHRTESSIATTEAFYGGTADMCLCKGSSCCGWSYARPRYRFHV